MNAFFKGPLSTSEAYAVAVTFCHSNGMILDLNMNAEDWRFTYDPLYKTNDLQFKTKTLCCFDCCWLSDFCSEQELFCIGGLNKFTFNSIIDAETGINYKSYINGLRQMTYNMSNGDGAFCMYDNVPESTGEGQMLFRLFAHQLSICHSKSKWAVKWKGCPVYIQDLMNKHCKNIKDIDFGNQGSKESKVHEELFKYKNEWLNLDMILKLFPNIERILYDATQKNVSFLRQKFIYESTLQFIKKNKRIKLQRIDISVNAKFDVDTKKYIQYWDKQYDREDWCIDMVNTEQMIQGLQRKHCFLILSSKKIAKQEIVNDQKEKADKLFYEKIGGSWMVTAVVYLFYILFWIPIFGEMHWCGLCVVIQILFSWFSVICLGLSLRNSLIPVIFLQIYDIIKSMYWLILIMYLCNFPSWLIIFITGSILSYTPSRRIMLIGRWNWRTTTEIQNVEHISSQKIKRTYLFLVKVLHWMVHRWQLHLEKQNEAFVRDTILVVTIVYMLYRFLWIPLFGELYYALGCVPLLWIFDQIYIFLIISDMDIVEKIDWLAYCMVIQISLSRFGVNCAGLSVRNTLIPVIFVQIYDIIKAIYVGIFVMYLCNFPNWLIIFFFGWLLYDPHSRQSIIGDAWDSSENGMEKSNKNNNMNNNSISKSECKPSNSEEKVDNTVINDKKTLISDDDELDHMKLPATTISESKQQNKSHDKTYHDAREFQQQTDSCIPERFINLLRDKAKKQPTSEHADETKKGNYNQNQSKKNNNDKTNSNQPSNNGGKDNNGQNGGKDSSDDDDKNNDKNNKNIASNDKNNMKQEDEKDVDRFFDILKDIKNIDDETLQQLLSTFSPTVFNKVSDGIHELNESLQRVTQVRSEITFPTINSME
eukprot:410896_1